MVYKNGLFLQRLLESHFFGKNELGAIGKELFKGFLQENTFEMKNKKIQRQKLYDSEGAAQFFDQSDRLICCLWSKFYDQYSSDDILSQGHLRASKGSERSVLYAQGLPHFFRNKQMLKEGSYKFLQAL